jgi:hypothetical protein
VQCVAVRTAFVGFVIITPDFLLSHFILMPASLYQAWIREHQGHPYPSNEEKEDLCKRTSMSTVSPEPVLHRFASFLSPQLCEYEGVFITRGTEETTFSLSTPFGLTLPVFSQDQLASWFKNARHRIVGGSAGKATKTKKQKD